MKGSLNYFPQISNYRVVLFYTGYHIIRPSSQRFRRSISKSDRPRNDSINEAICTSSALPRAFSSTTPCTTFKGRLRS